MLLELPHDSGVQMIRTDLVAGLKSGSFDLILFNPPYLPTNPEERIDDWLEYALDGGSTGREVITRFLGVVPDILAPEGRVLLLTSSLTGFPETFEIIRQNGWKFRILMQERVEGGEFLIISLLTR